MLRPRVLPMGKDHEASQTESSPKMSRTKVLSAGKGHAASQDESGATTADPMSELLTMITKKFEEVSPKFEELGRLLVRRGNKLDDMAKEIRNINQHRAGLQQLQAQQPRLAVKADVLDDEKTRESREDFVPDGRLGDVSSDRIHDPMRLTSFGDQGYIEPPALPCRDDALVNQGPEVPKLCLSPVEMRKSTHLPVAYYTPSQLLLSRHKGPTFPHNFFLGASERRARRRILVRQQDIHSPSTTVLGTQR